MADRKVKRKVEPCPTLLYTLRTPPCNSISSLHSCRPRPVPFSAWVLTVEAPLLKLNRCAIDPADTRHFLGQTLKAVPTPATRNHRKRAIDAW